MRHVGFGRGAVGWLDRLGGEYKGLLAVLAVVVGVVAAVGTWYAVVQPNASGQGTNAQSEVMDSPATSSAEDTRTESDELSSSTTQSLMTTTSRLTTTTRPPVPDSKASARLGDLLVYGTGGDLAKVNWDTYTDSFVSYLPWCSADDMQRWDFDLSRKHKTVTGMVGITDESVDDSPLRARILVDGELAFERDFVLGQAEAFSLDVTGALRLTFVTVALEDFCGSLFADGPKLAFVNTTVST
jgi:hypothetical protein